MEEIQCDLITITCKKGLLPSLKHSFRYVLTLKDCFSKYCWLFPLKSKEGTPIANILLKLFHEHGAPTYLHSDNGTEFVNRFVTDACSRFNVVVVHGRPYHPQSQGQVENLNRRVKNCLRHFLLQYPEDERCDVWPSIVKEIEYFLNHSWHHTVRSTPYSIFFGRFELRNVGKVPVQPEFMEEDFMYATDNDNDFEFNLHALQSVTVVSVPDYSMCNDQPRTLLACNRSHQEEQKRCTFEATEATIARNRRSQVKKIRARNFSVGDAVLFKNPTRSGIATTLNVEGCIEEKVGRDLYRVSYGDLHVTLFAAEMVPNTVSTGNSAIDVQRTTTWEPRIILDKICVYADMQRSLFSARRKYKQELHSINMERKIKDIGYNFTLGDDVDLTSLFYIALDCGFLSTVTEDDQWNKDLEKYSTSLLAFLQEKRFHYFLSGIYWWECFRCQTVHIVMQSVLEKAIPLFHYCSECVDDGKCTHACCKLWLRQACVHRGIDVQMPGSGNEDGLLLLATVATEENEKQHQCNASRIPSKRISKDATTSWPLPQPQKDNMLKASKCASSLKLRKTGFSPVAKCSSSVPLEDNEELKRLKRNLTFRKYVVQNLPMVQCGVFTSRVEKIVNQIGKCVSQWNTLDDDNKENLYLNTRYIIDTISMHKQTDAIKQVSSMPFMQNQGASHYCSVCALNNLVGKEITTAHEMNDVADNLWLNHFDYLGQSVTDNIQPHRDPNGFHTIDTMQQIAMKNGYCLWTLDKKIQSCKKLVPKSSPQLVHELLRCYKSPAKLLVHNKKVSHYAAINVYHRQNVWYFDSLKRQPITITADELMAILADKDTTTFSLKEEVQPADQMPVSDQSSSNTVGYTSALSCMTYFATGSWTRAGGIYVNNSEV